MKFQDLNYIQHFIQCTTRMCFSHRTLTNPSILSILKGSRTQDERKRKSISDIWIFDTSDLTIMPTLN